MGHARARDSTYHRCKCFDCRNWRHVFLYVSHPPVYVFSYTGIDTLCDLDSKEVDSCAPIKQLEPKSVRNDAGHLARHNQRQLALAVATRRVGVATSEGMPC